MNTTIELLEKLFDNNNLSHAILIETNNQDFCVEQLYTLIKKMSCLDEYNFGCNNCNLCKMIESQISLNCYFIEPDGKNIKKEQVLALKDKCSVMPVLSKNNVYVIKNAENLSISAANTMLKFIEEPFDNCFGFFITNNKDNMINTIKSRCEFYTVKYKNDNLNSINDKEYKNILDNIKIYLKHVEEKPKLLYNKELFNEEYKDRNKCEEYFKVMLDVYNYYFNLKLNRNFDTKYADFEYINSNNLTNLIAKRKIIVTILNNIGYNLNIDLLLDKFIIEMSEVK